MRFLYGKNVLLTGGSSGIGLAAAELLAGRGYTVYAASRNPAARNRDFPGGGGIIPVVMDVRDDLSVSSVIRDALRGIDIGIVIHCAGMGIACAAEESPRDAVAGLLEVNFSGVLRVNSHILPALRNRGGGLCLIIGSVAGIFPIPYQSHYSASKAALCFYASALRMELRRHSVKICLIMPGDTKTGFTGARKFVIDTESPFYSDCMTAVRKMEKDETNGKPPVSAARIIAKLCERNNPPARRIVGFDYKLLAFLSRLLPYSLVELALRRIYLGGKNK